MKKREYKDFFRDISDMATSVLTTKFYGKRLKNICRHCSRSLKSLLHNG